MPLRPGPPRAAQGCPGHEARPAVPGAARTRLKAAEREPSRPCQGPCQGPSPPPGHARESN